MISPFFFHEIRNTNTGALIDFTNPTAPEMEEKPTKEKYNEVILPPPEGATGFYDSLKVKMVVSESGNLDSPVLCLVSKKQDGNFQDRFPSIKGIKDNLTRERELIKIAKEWNSQDIEVFLYIIQKKEVVGRDLVRLIKALFYNN